MPREWFIKSRRGHLGPISSRALARLARKGKLTPNAGVSPDGVNWFKAKRISDLTFPETEPKDKDASPYERSKKSTRKLNEATKRWYVQTKNGVAGPLSLRRLNKLAAKGRLLPNVAVSYDQERWVKAKRVRGLDFPSEGIPSAPVLPAVAELPVIQEVPVSGPLPTIEQLPSRLPVALPVVRELPIAGPLPLLSDLPPRTNPRVVASLPVVAELPIVGPLPRIEQLRSRLPVALPVVNELPIAGPLPQLSDLPPRTKPRVVVALPVVNELPIAGPLPTLSPLPSSDSQSAARLDYRSEYATIRERAFTDLLGPASHIIRPTEPDGVSVCIHPPNQRRPFTTMVTSGMSDHTMKVPSGPWSPRAELIWYVDQTHPGYVESLRSLAQIPSRYGRGFFFGSTMDNGDPPAPVFANSLLRSFLFMVSSVREDHALCESVTVDDSPLQLLWVVPITLPERMFLNTYGMQQFCWLLDQNQHSICNQPGRRCFASNNSSLAM